MRRSCSNMSTREGRRGIDPLDLHRKRATHYLRVIPAKAGIRRTAASQSRRRLDFRCRGKDRYVSFESRDDDGVVSGGARMSGAAGLMAGRRGLVMGVANDHSIAWGIAKALAEHGAELAFTYQGEALGKRVRPLAESVGSNLALPCDVEDLASVDKAFETLKERWGAIDF